ncbi:hypothetical protein I0D00_08515 [Pseudomonas lalucatii]|uniref:Uncharacterized protein n=1 Tax=Pseudomonas lalucatii TaxID=1424203 RepID=A0ABS5Q1I8_9PSED|nr:hypothetical protein [Pseudomonas lalucatii]MBS7661979.1 hypothetical protein [Pseudomonas lalucatii]
MTENSRMGTLSLPIRDGAPAATPTVNIETKPIVMKSKNHEKQKNSGLCRAFFYGSINQTTS